jgi:hypothetical protein
MKTRRNLNLDNRPDTVSGLFHNCMFPCFIIPSKVHPIIRMARTLTRPSCG